MLLLADPFALLFEAVFDALVTWTERLLNLTFYEFVSLFWFSLLLDIPRYLLTDVYILWQALRGRGDGAPPLSAEAWPTGRLPSVSVVVAALDEAETIEATVRSLLENGYPDLEILAVDDGSTDGTFDILLRLEHEFEGRVRAFRKAVRGGKASCLNLALLNARGDLIVSIDSDTTFDRDALLHLLGPFADPGVGAVSGNIRVRNRETNLLTRLQAFEYVVTISTARRFLSRFDLLTIVSGAFGAFRRSALESFGAWDPGIGDDSNVTLKTRKLGFRIAFAPRAVAMTNCPETLRGLYRQRRRWEKSFIRNRFRKHRDLLDPRLYRATSLVAIGQAFFFRVVLLVSFLTYLVWMLTFYPESYAFVLFSAVLLYGWMNGFSLAVAILLSERPREDLALLQYSPLMVPYRLLLRCIRAVAYAQEAFRIGYEEPFYPAKVWRQAPRW